MRPCPYLMDPDYVAKKDAEIPSVPVSHLDMPLKQRDGYFLVRGILSAWRFETKPSRIGRILVTPARL